MKLFIITVILAYSSLIPLKAQFFLQDPGVNDAYVVPNPPSGLTAELDIGFLLGNNGTDAISGEDASQQMGFTVNMSKCFPSVGATVSATGTDALSGEALLYFDFTYDPDLNTFTAIQKINTPIGLVTSFELVIHAVVTELSSSIADNTVGARMTIQPNEASARSNDEENDYVEALTHTATLLPIELSAFTGSSLGCDASLVWKTAMEENFSHFEVEYSADGITFTVIKAIPGKNSKTGNNYSAIVRQPDAEGYYRLKMVDIDHKFVYSRNVVLIRTQCNANIISISPNPVVNNRITVRGLAQKSAIQVFDVDGKQLQRIVAAHSVQYLDLSGYASGVYFIHVIQGNRSVQQFKIIKK
jgi:hypothetical protein